MSEHVIRTLHCDVVGGQYAACPNKFEGLEDWTLTQVRALARRDGWRTEGPHALALSDICPRHPIEPPGEAS